MEEKRIRELLPRVRDEKVREAAESLLDGRAQMISVMGPLLHALKNPQSKWEDRMTSAWSLGYAQLSPNQSEAAAGTLGWYVQNHPVSPPALTDPPARALLQGLIVFALLSILALLRMDLMRWYPFLAGVLTMCIVLAVSASQRRAIDLIITVMRSLSRIGSPNVLKPVMSLYRQAESLRSLHGTHDFKDAVADALESTLKSIGRAEAGSLTADSIPVVASVLKVRDAEIVRLGLHALKAVGDGRAIPAVEGLIRSKKHRNLGALAESTLEILRERQRKAADSANLLRAAGAAADEGLLRSVAGGASTEEILLRAADSAD